MTIITGASVAALKPGKGGTTATIEPMKGSKTKAQTVTAEKVILAVGITGNVEDCGLDTVKGVEVDRGHVVVNGWLETGVKGVYAIGDLVGPPWLAHKAMHEAVICVDKTRRPKRRPPHDDAQHPGLHLLPPAGRQVGLTEKAAKEQGLQIKVGSSRSSATARPSLWANPKGLIKTVFDAKPANCWART